jgi:hypothetical protein
MDREIATMSEQILAHLSTISDVYQTAQEIAAVVTPGERYRPVAEALHSMVEGGTVEREQHDGLLGSGPKRYRKAVR